MNTRAFTGAPLRVLPLLLALLFNTVLVSAQAFMAPGATRAVVGSPGLSMLTTVAADPIEAGDEVSFTITVWNDGPVDAFEVVLHDDLPSGLTWDLEQLDADSNDDCGMASSQLPGGEAQMSIDCTFGTLGPASGKVIRVFAETDRTDCGQLDNTAWVDASNTDRIEGEASMRVRCPEIALQSANDAVGSVRPGTEVGYTLILNVSNGPAEDVVVVDDLPDALAYVPGSASDGGRPGDAPSMIEWNLGDLADGEYSLTYRAVVSEAAEAGDELVNVASATSLNSQCPDLETLGPECGDASTIVVRLPAPTIDGPPANETPQDEEQGSVRTPREGELGGNPTPRPLLPDTAVGIGLAGQPITVPTALLVAFFLGSLAAVALAKKPSNHRR